MGQTLFAIIIGWIAGVAVNYFADVLPYRKGLTLPVCKKCGTHQSDVRYWFWPARCNNCGMRRSWRNIIVEVVFIITSIYLWQFSISIIEFSVNLLLIAYLGLVSVIDIEHRLILHPVSLVGALLGLGFGTWQHGFYATIIGGLVMFGIMLLLYFFGMGFVKLWERIRGHTINEEALGFGDVTLGGVIGLLLGWPGIVAGIFLTIFLAGVVSFVYYVFALFFRKYKPNLALPFGPFLVMSAILLLYFHKVVLAPLGW